MRNKGFTAEDVLVRLQAPIRCHSYPRVVNFFPLQVPPPLKLLSVSVGVSRLEVGRFLLSALLHCSAPHLSGIPLYYMHIMQPHAPRVQRAQRRGTSFDAGGTSLREAGAGTCDVRGCAPNSARGNFAFASMDVSNDATNAAAKAPGNQKALPGNLFATFGGAAASSSSGHSTVNFRGQEQLIPAYVPVSKHGSLSQATHRRSSSRSGGMTNDIISGFPAGFSAEGGGGIGEGARRRAGSPQQSPSIAVKYPPRVLPPVPAFNDPGVPQGPPAPPPPSLSEGENRGRGSVFDTTLLPPAYDRVTENAVQAGRWGSDGSVRDVRIDGVAWQVSLSLSSGVPTDWLGVKKPAFVLADCCTCTQKGIDVGWKLIRSGTCISVVLMYQGTVS